MSKETIKRSLIDTLDYLISTVESTGDRVSIIVIPKGLFDLVSLYLSLSWYNIGNTRQIVYCSVILERENADYHQYVNERFYRKIKYGEDF